MLLIIPYIKLGLGTHDQLRKNRFFMQLMGSMKSTKQKKSLRYAFGRNAMDGP